MKILALALMVLAACAGMTPDQPSNPGSPGSPDGGGSGDAPPTGTPPATAFDCTALEAPLSANKFYEDNPTYTDPVDDTASWTMSTPEAEGLDATMLEQASTTLSNAPYSWSFLVIRNDKLVFERYYHGSAKNQSNNVHSASKSIWGASIGIAIAKGVIASPDATIASILPASYVALMNTQKKSITVRHLVMMTSGIDWTEDTTENDIQTTPDWMAAILGLPMANTPGATFNYSTGNAHLNSAVLAAAAHTTACEFIHDFNQDSFDGTMVMQNDILPAVQTRVRRWGAALRYRAASACRAASAQRDPPLTSQAANTRELRARG